MPNVERIMSRDNRRLVHARKVRDGKVATQVFIEGKRLVIEALRSDIDLDACFVTEGFEGRELLGKIAQRTTPIAEMPERLFNSIADTSQPQGIILIAKRPRTSLDALGSSLKGTGLPIVIFLTEINDPSNLGAVLRTAEAAGAAGVIISTNSADAYSPKALRASMGASFRLPVCEGAEFEEVMDWARAEKLRTIAAVAGSGRNYVDIVWKEPALLVLGSEAHGLTLQQLDRIEEQVGIPMENDVESLNLAVSAGIILFEAKRQNT